MKMRATSSSSLLNSGFLGYAAANAPGNQNPVAAQNLTSNEKESREINLEANKQCINVIKSNIETYFLHDNIEKIDFSNLNQDGIDTDLLFQESQLNQQQIQENQISLYKREYEELQQIGTGGFGAVFRVINKLDQNIYAIKKIKLSMKNEALNQKTIKEVTFLAKLQHPTIIRYYFVISF